MTATPIPRTLAITAYGDMDISTIDEMPAGRQPVETFWVKRDVWSRVVDFIGKTCGRTASLRDLSPHRRIRKGGPPKRPRRSLKRLLSLLHRSGSVCCTAECHGRKEEVMQSFADNQTQVLVSTTVVEVGVNVT